MKLRPSLYLAMLIALTTVGCNAFEFPEFRGGLDAENPSDMSEVDMFEADASDGDVGQPEDSGSDSSDTGPDLGPSPVTFEVSIENPRVAMDSDVPIEFQILDGAEQSILCDELAYVPNPDSDALGDVDVNNDTAGVQAVFAAQEPGRATLRFTCDGLEAEVEITVLPTPRAELDDLAVWHRFDLGVVADSDLMLSAENLVDGSASAGVMGELPVVTPEGAIRFEAANRFELANLLELRDAEIILVYDNASTGAASLIGYNVDGNNQIQIPASQTGQDINLVTNGQTQPGVATWEFTDSLNSLLIYRFSLRYVSPNLNVSLSVDKSTPAEKSIGIPTGEASEYFFPVKNFGSFGEELRARGKLHEVIIFDGPVEEQAWDEIYTYLRDRYPEP